MKTIAQFLSIVFVLSTSIGQAFGQPKPSDEILVTAKEAKLYRVEGGALVEVGVLREWTPLRAILPVGPPPMVEPRKDFTATQPRNDGNVRIWADCLIGQHPGFLLKAVPVVPFGYRYVEVVTGAGGGQKGWINRAKCINLNTLAECRPLHPLHEIRGGSVYFPEPDFMKIPALILNSGNKTIVGEWRRLNALFEESNQLFDKQTVPQFLGLSANPLGSPFAAVAMLQAKSVEKQKMKLPELYFARAELWNKVGDKWSALDDLLAGAEVVRLTNQNMLTFSKAFVKLQEHLVELEKQPVAPRAGKAPSYFGEGVSYFWSGNNEKALKYFNDAVQLAPYEPLYWYYRALTYRRIGDERRAVRDARIGVDLEWEERNQNKRIHDEPFMLQALERVQGPMRVWLQQFRNATPEFRISKD